MPRALPLRLRFPFGGSAGHPHPHALGPGQFLQPDLPKFAGRSCGILVADHPNLWSFLLQFVVVQVQVHPQTPKKNTMTKKLARLALVASPTTRHCVVMLYVVICLLDIVCCCQPITHSHQFIINSHYHTSIPRLLLL